MRAQWRSPRYQSRGSTLRNKISHRDRRHPLLALEEEVRRKRTSAHRYVGQACIKRVLSHNWNECAYDGTSSASQQTERQPSLRDGTRDAPELARVARLDHLLGAGQVEPELNEGLRERHERHDVGVYRITLRLEHAREVRQGEQRQNVFDELQTVLP